MQKLITFGFYLNYKYFIEVLKHFTFPIIFISEFEHFWAENEFYADSNFYAFNP